MIWNVWNVVSQSCRLLGRSQILYWAVLQALTWRGLFSLSLFLLVAMSSEAYLLPPGEGERVVVSDVWS